MSCWATRCSLRVVVLGVAAQHLERALRVEVEPLHQDALRLADEVARVDRLAQVLVAACVLHRDRRVPRQHVRDVGVGLVEGAGLRVVEVEAADDLLAGVEARAEHAADPGVRDRLAPPRPPRLLPHVADDHLVPVRDQLEVGPLAGLELDGVEPGDDGVGRGHGLDPGAAVHEDHPGVAAAEGLDRELQDALDGLVEAVDVVQVEGEPGEGLGIGGGVRHRVSCGGTQKALGRTPVPGLWHARCPRCP